MEKLKQQKINLTKNVYQNIDTGARLGLRESQPKTLINDRIMKNLNTVKFRENHSTRAEALEAQKLLTNAHRKIRT